MPLRGQISRAGLARREELKKPRFCICGCGDRLPVLAYMFYPYSRIPEYKRGHADTIGMCGHSQTEETRKKIGIGASRNWKNQEFREKATAWKRTSVGQAILVAAGMKSAGKRPRTSKTLRFQYASGEREPLGSGSFKVQWLKTQKGGVVFCVGTWEPLRCKVMDEDKDVLKFKKNPFRIPYRFAGKTRTYFPDFLVIRRNGSRTLEEVKGYLPGEKAVANWKAKEKAARKFCESNKLKFAVLTSLRQVLGG